MAKIVEFRKRQGRKHPHPEVSLAVDADLCNDVHIRNLIDDWIVPKMVDEWICQTGANPLANDDNGEHNK